MDIRSLSIISGCCLALYTAGCMPAKTVMVGEDSKEETRVLFTAKQGLPADTSGGVYAIGTARPGESSRLGARAEHSALLRLWARFGLSGASRPGFLKQHSSPASRSTHP